MFVRSPNVGPFWYDPLPATEHSVLYGRQQEALRSQLQHGVDSFQPHLSPLQLQEGNTCQTFCPHGGRKQPAV